MKRRRGYRKSVARNTIAKLCILIAVIFGFAGVSYAAYSNVLTGYFHISTGNMNFIFDDDQNVVVQMQNGTDGEIKDLGGKVAYDNKKLLISDIGPIDIEDLMNGDANITIQYAIKAEDNEKGMKRPAEIKSSSDSGYDLGIVEFELLSHTPVWSLENDYGSWGTKSSGIESTPDIVYEFLPDHLGDFQVYNQLLPHYDDEFMVGTLLLQQVSGPVLTKTTEIGLSSLGLSSELNSEIKNGSPESLLEVKGSYGFSIPLNLDQFNLER